MKLGWVWATKKLWLLLFLFPVVGVSQDDDLREGWQWRFILSSVFNRLASLSIATKSEMDKLDTLAPWNMFWSNFSQVLFTYLVCLSGKVFFLAEFSEWSLSLTSEEIVDVVTKWLESHALALKSNLSCLGILSNFFFWTLVKTSPKIS